VGARGVSGELDVKWHECVLLDGLRARSRRDRHQDIERAGPHPANPPGNDACARRLQIVPIAIQYRILQETHRGFEAHLGKRADCALHANPAKGAEAAASGHHIGNEAEMPIVDRDAVASEDGIHLSDDGRTAGFDPIEAKHGGDIVCENLVGVDDVLVVMHGREVDTLRYGGGDLGFDVGDGVSNLLHDNGAGADAGNELDDCRTTGGLDQVEHEHFGRRDVELAHESAKRASEPARGRISEPRVGSCTAIHLSRQTRISSHCDSCQTARLACR
jgi:hypothetical protein